MGNLCPICGDQLKREARDELKNRTVYECLSCGRYIIADMVGLNEENMCAMYHHILCKGVDTCSVFCAGVSEEHDTGYAIVYPKELSALWPRTFQERVDKTLLNFTNMGEIGHLFYPRTIAVKHAVWEREDDAQPFLNLLCEMGYMKPSGGSFELTANAWLKVEQLQRENRDANQGFVAMWFSEEMSTARDAIKQAIVACGYTVKIIDEKEHNNQIVPEILYEIKRSRFIVADLTGHRNGVYYEAGYGEAMGKQVILTCKADAFKECHFDVAQKSTIIWKTAEELRDRLEKRIVATIGRK